MWPCSFSVRCERCERVASLRACDVTTSTSKPRCEKRIQAIQKQKEYQRKKIERDKFEKERLRLEKVKQEQLQLKKMRIEYVNHIFENKQNVKQFKSEIILLEKKLFKLNPILYIKKCLKEIGFSLLIIFFLLFVFWFLVLWIMLHYIY